MSFIHLNNKKDQVESQYSADVIKLALLKAETKSNAKASGLVENIKEPVSLSEALSLFSDKLKGIKYLTESLSVIAIEEAAALEASKTELTLEGTMSEIHMLAKEAKDVVDFTKKFFKEFGDKIKKSADSTQWVESLYTDAVSEDHSENPNDIYDVRPCDKAGTPWSVWEGDVQVKCFETEEEAEAYATEQNKEQGLTEEYDGNMSDFKYEFPMRFEEETGNSPKAIKKMAKQGKKGYEVRTSTYMSQTEMEKVGLALGLNLKSYTKGGSVAISVYESTVVANEAFSRMSSDTIETELYSASQELSNYYDWLKAGNDSGKGKTLDSIVSLLKKCKNDIKKFNTKEETIGTKYEAPVVEGNVSDKDFHETEEVEEEQQVDEARFVKDFNEDVLDAKTKEEVLKLYPNAEFFVGKSDHFFGELDDNLFFKAYYTKAQKEFSIKSVYSKKGSNYVHLYNRIGESVVNEGRSINKIQTEWSQTTTNMVQKVADWKAAEGDRKIELLEELKSLTAKKKELEIELDAKVAGKDKDVKLAIEGNAFESLVNEAKFKKGQYIKAKKDSDNFDGDVYDKTNDVDGSEILKNSSFEIYEIGKDEVILWSDADEVEYSIDPDDLKNFVKESVVTEAKNLSDMKDVELVSLLDHIKTGPSNLRDKGFIQKIEKELKKRGVKEGKLTEAKAVKVTKKEWPYVEFKIGSTKHKVEFDYEDIIDDHGNEGQDQYWLGKDDDGKEWSIDVYADYNGDVQDVHYDTIVAESVVTEKKEEKDEAAEIEAEIEKLTKENKHGYAKDIKRLKVRLSAVNMMKKFNKNNESKKVAWDNLLEEFEIVETTNEGLRSDVKNFIKDNKDELNDLADNDEWDMMYQKLYDEFGVESDTIKAKDLLKTFQFVF